MVFVPNNFRSYVGAAKKGIAIFQGARAAYNVLKRRSSGATGPNPKRMKMTRAKAVRSTNRRQNVSYARSAGFIKRGKKKYARKNYKKAKWGISLNKEAGKLYTSPEVLFLGHSTFPVQTIRECMWRALIKRLFIMAGGFDVVDLQRTLPANTEIALYWKNDGVTGAQTSYVLTPAGTPSIESVAQTFSSSTNLFNDGLYANTRIYTWLTMRTLPGFTQTDELQQARLSMNNVFINFDVSSDYKIQNRSVNQNSWTAQDAENVDNVPIFGKSYEGSGTGAVIKNYANQPGNFAFTADQMFGLIEGNGNTNNLYEPPYASDFMGVKKSGKVRIEPGTIKTSKLYYKRRIGFVQMQRELGTSDDTQFLTGAIPQVNKKTLRLGNYRFFGVEKMMDPVPAHPMTIAVEHNLRVNCWADVKETHHTVQITEKDFLPQGTF